MPSDDQWAADLDVNTKQQIGQIGLPSASILMREIRLFLDSQVERLRLRSKNNIFALLRFTGPDRQSGIAHIELGPKIDKGLDDSHFRFASGARLSFGISVREEMKVSHLLAYRYHLQLPEGSAPSYFRIDLNSEEASQTPRFHEPRSHVHPGEKDLRLPHPVLEPVHQLSRIFHQIESHFYKQE